VKNRLGFTLIQMAALIMILGVALVVVARHFNVSNVTESVNRFSGEVNDADRELRLFLAKYRYMPNHTNRDYEGNPRPGHRFMDNDSSTTPELYKTFRPRNFFQLMYVAPVREPNDENWTGDICATLPHTAPYTPNIIPPNDNYSVNVSYCNGELNSLGTCSGTPRMTLNGMIYTIVHPGDDGAFQSRIVGGTLYVPAEGNDDLIRYLSIRDAYDLGDCAFRIARVPKLDPRYHNAARGAGNVVPATIRTWTTVAENLINGSSCTTRTSPTYEADDLDASGANRYGGQNTVIPYDYVQSCSAVHLEYPLNRYGENYASEKCCIELQNNRVAPGYYATGLPLPKDNFTSNCQLNFEVDGACPVDGGKDLKGQTPYINIITPFTTNVLGPVTNTSLQGYIPARLKITFRNGNRLYRIDDQADIFRVEFW
jgi:hypothetical protein